MERERGFVKALTQYRATCSELFNLIKDEEKARIRRWEEERPSFELLIASLNQTCDVIKKDKKRLAAELSAKQAAAVSCGGTQSARASHKPLQQDHSFQHAVKDPAVLQRELDELNSRVLATDIEIKVANKELATCERADERDYLSTKCVVLQDTRRILLEEMQALRSDLARLDASSRVEAERRRAEESGWAEVARLEEALEKTTARLDRVKQQLYFPEAKGYRFSSGNGGIYVAARDLHVSEVSGRFEFTCEPIKRRAAVTAATSGGGAASAAAAAAHGNRVARLTVALGGVSASTALAEWSESRRGSAQAARPGSSGGGGGGGDSSVQSGNAGGGKLSHSSSTASAASMQGAGAVAEGDISQGEGLSQDPSALALQSSAPLPQLSQLPQAQMSQTLSRSGASTPEMTPSPGTPTAVDGVNPGTSAQANTVTGAQHPLQQSPMHQPSPPSPQQQLQQSPTHQTLVHQQQQQQQSVRFQSLPPGLPPHLHQQYIRQQQQFLQQQQQQQQQQQRSPLHGTMSGPPPTAPSPVIGRLHRRAPSQGTVSIGSGGGGGGLTTAPAPRAKGEAVTNFLSGLKNKKEKLKHMVGGLMGDRDHSDGSAVALRLGAMTGPAGGGGAVAPAGQAAHGHLDNSASGSGRLRTQMMEKLQDGFFEGRGKLSRISKAIVTKAPDALRDMKTKIRPAGRQGSAGGAVEADWEAENDSSRHYQQLDGALLDGNTLPTVDADADHFGADGGSGGRPLQHLASMGSTGIGSGGGSGGAGSSPGGDSIPNSIASAPVASWPEGLSTAGDDSDLLGGFVEDFECRPSRKGVYVQLLGEGVELLGERGTKVPDTSIREMMLEVEVAVTAVFEYHAAGGPAGGGGAWLAPEPVSFNILQLDHRMRGNTLPLPRTLLKGLLNAYMPGLLTGLLSKLLPAELGTYTACSGESQALSGEFKVAGPSLSTTVTSIAPPPKPSSDPSRRAQWVAVQAAASRARAMLGLSEAQGAAISELFGGCGRPSLVPDSTGFTPSISGLCRFYTTYIKSDLWTPLVGLLNRALQTAFEFHGVKPAERFQLSSFLDGSVARLVRKPLRIAFTIERLSLSLDCDAALTTIRDFFERMAREFEAKTASRGGGGGASGGGGDAAGGPPREPLEVQLELLDLWHAALAKMLRTFKQRFRSAGATLLASADRRVFQIGAESVSYDGPLKLKLPIDLAMDPDGSFMIDVKLPDREQATKSITSLLTEVMYSLSTTHNSVTGAATTAAAAAAAASRGSTGGISTSGAAAAVAATVTTGGTNAIGQLNTAFITIQQQQQELQQGPGHGKGGLSEPPSHASTAQAVRARAAAVQGMLGSASSAADALGAGSSSTSVVQEQHQQRPPSPVAMVQSGSAMFDIGHEWAAALAEGMPEGSAVASGAAPLLQNPVVGQLCVKKLALSLKLDEERVMELLSMPGGMPALSASATTAAAGSSASGAAAADIAGRLLGCYGDLFTASMDLGWRPESDVDGAAQRACCMMTVQSNDITRLRAEVDGLWFQSTVSPRLAVRVLQAVVIALVLKFHAADSYSIRFWNRAFNQLHEYLSRGSLDLAVCLSARATMNRAADRLRVELSGQDLNASASGAGGGGAGGAPGQSQGLLGRVCPVYLLNDVNLMTVFDSIKLLTETAPPPSPPQQQGD